MKGLPIFEFVLWLGFCVMRYSMHDADLIWDIYTVLLFSPLVLFPIAYQLLELGPRTRIFLAICVGFLWIGFMLPGGPSGGFAIPWFIFVSVISVLQLRPLFTALKTKNLSDLSIRAGVAYPVIGGVWLLASLFHKPFMGFQEPIVTLTAVHFHYAGFAAPIIAGLSLRNNPNTPTRTLILIGTTFGPFLVAIGITLGGVAEMICGSVLGVILIALGALMIKSAAETRGANRILRIISGVSIIGTMLFAITYALRNSISAEISNALGFNIQLSIPWMVRIHGVINAIGFSLFGMLSLRQPHQLDSSRTP